MRRRSLFIYLPAILLLIAAIVLPQMGRDLIDGMNAHEFALFLALWWMIVVIVWRVGRAIFGRGPHGLDW